MSWVTCPSCLKKIPKSCWWKYFKPKSKLFQSFRNETSSAVNNRRDSFDLFEFNDYIKNGSLSPMGETRQQTDSLDDIPHGLNIKTYKVSEMYGIQGMSPKSKRIAETKNAIKLTSIKETQLLCVPGSADQDSTECDMVWATYNNSLNTSMSSGESNNRGITVSFEDHEHEDSVSTLEKDSASVNLDTALDMEDFKRPSYSWRAGSIKEEEEGRMEKSVGLWETIGQPVEDDSSIREGGDSYMDDRFKISNRIPNVVRSFGECVLAKDIISINKDGALLLEWIQARLRRTMTWNQKFYYVAWFLFWLWLLVCSIILIVFGINMDLNNTYVAEESIVEAAASDCPATQIGTTELHVDVNATDAMNLEISLAQAAEQNAGWEAYPEDPVQLFADNVPESDKFLIGSFGSWCLGIFVTSLLHSPVAALVTTLQSVNRKKELLATVEEMAEFISLKDISDEDLLIMLLYNPSAILTFYSTPIYEESVTIIAKRHLCSYCIKCILFLCGNYQQGTSKNRTNIFTMTIVDDDSKPVSFEESDSL